MSIDGEPCPDCGAPTSAGRIYHNKRGWRRTNQYKPGTRCPSCAANLRRDPSIRREGNRALYTVTCPTCEEVREVTGVGKERYKRCPYCVQGTPLQLRDAAWLEAAYAQYSSVEIAEQLGCAGPTVIAWLRRHEIRVRTKEEAGEFRFRGTKGRVALGRNRQMVTGRGLPDSADGAVRHLAA